MTTEVMEERQERVSKIERTRGYVKKWFPDRGYGFIGVKGLKDEGTKVEKQFHFHKNSVRFSQRNLIAAGVSVDFVPLSLSATPGFENKRDKATAIVVVG